MALTKLTKNLIDGTFGTEWVSTIQTSNFTAEAAKGYFVNTTSAEITINLPAGVVGTEIVIQDYAGTFATNKVIFAANGSEKIQGIESTSVTNYFKCPTDNATVTLVYQDATKGWTANNIELNVLPPLLVDYLVVAGGGGGGAAFGGGGGAGGYLTNYGGTALSLTAATNYIVTIGAGGAGGIAPATYGKGTNGYNSVFSSITSIGGGAGASYFPSTGSDSIGNNGGSGGGGATNESVGNTFAGGTGSQGNNGGSGLGGQPYCSGGGGGAGAVGANSGSTFGGGGGAGLSSSIDGSAVIRAGGGGGGAYTQSNNSTPGVGGAGGGGAGAGNANQNAFPGTVNTGSGGGGGGYPQGNGGLGGSGIVILRYPSDYTISLPLSGLSGTTTTVGTDKVTTFTAGTGNITFS